MKPPGGKYWPVLLSGLALLLLMVWAVTWGRKPRDQHWLVMSIPALATTRGPVPQAAVLVSNVGPRAVDFRLCWFECRDQQQKRLLSSNPFSSIVIPLWPGKSTNLPLNIAAAGLPPQEYWCCAEVLWAERDSVSSRWARKLDWVINQFDLTRNPVPLSRELLQGYVFTGNVKVSDYFSHVYGKTRSQWFALARKMPSILAPPKNNGIYFPGSGLDPEERVTLQAESAFTEFCRTPTNALLVLDPQ